VVLPRGILVESIRAGIYPELSLLEA